MYSRNDGKNATDVLRVQKKSRISAFTQLALTLFSDTLKQNKKDPVLEKACQLLLIARKDQHQACPHFRNIRNYKKHGRNHYNQYTNNIIRTEPTKRRKNCS